MQTQSNHTKPIKAEDVIQLAGEGKVRDSKHERDLTCEKGCSLLRWKPGDEHLEVATES